MPPLRATPYPYRVGGSVFACAVAILLLCVSHAVPPCTATPAPPFQYPPTSYINNTVLKAGYGYSTLNILPRDWSKFGVTTYNFSLMTADQARRETSQGLLHAAFADFPISASSLSAQSLLQFPIFASALAVSFNVPADQLPAGVSIQTGAPFSRKQLMGVFTGSIKTWDHPDMRSIFTFEPLELYRNASVVIPNKPIKIIYRSLASNTNRWFQTAMNKFDYAKFNAAPDVYSASGQAMTPNSDASANSDLEIAKIILANEWSMGYVLLPTAIDTALPMFAIENKNGNFKMPTALTLTESMESVQLDDVLNTDTIDMSGQNVYPIFVTTWMSVHNYSLPCDIARQLEHIWEWIAFSDESLKLLNGLSLSTLGPRIWQAALLRIHTMWKCTNEDKTIESVSMMPFRAFKTTAISRRTFNALALEYTTKSNTSAIALTDSLVDGTNEDLSSSLEVLGSLTKQCVTLPVAVSGIAFPYNTPFSTATGELMLTREVIVGIFNGTITMWNHPLIVSSNRFMPMPKQPITLVLRGGAAGQQLTSVLYAILSSWSAEWRATFGTTLSTLAAGNPFSWFPNVPASRTVVCEDGAKSTCTLLGTLLATKHTFSYMEGFADSNVFVASVQNVAGSFVSLNELALNTAVSNAKLLNESIIVNPSDTGAYPAVFIASFRAPLVYAGTSTDESYSTEAIAVAQRRADLINLRFSEAAFKTCPSAVTELEFIIWAGLDPSSHASLALGKMVAIAQLDHNWRRNLLAIQCAPAGANGADFFTNAIYVLEEPPLIQTIIKNGINMWIVIGLGFGVIALVAAALAFTTLQGRKQLRMVQDLSLAVATFDLDSMEWLERKPAKGLMGCYKQILLNMKVYKQYLPSSLTERHTEEASSPGAVDVKGAKRRASSLPDVMTGESGNTKRSNGQQQKGRRVRADGHHTESSGSKTNQKSYSSMAAQLRRGTFVAIKFGGLSTPRQTEGGDQSTDINARQATFNSLFAIVNKAVKDKRGIVEDFSYDHVVCHWNLHRNVGDYRLLACECALQMQNDLLQHIKAQSMDVIFDITVTSGDIVLSSIGNDSKQRITWISRAWSRSAAMHAFNAVSGCLITIDESTKSAVEYSVDCLLMDVINAGPANESVFVYDLGGTAAVEDGEWMYHNQVKNTISNLNSPDEATSQDDSTALSPASSQITLNVKSNSRTQLMLSWSSIVTCLCVRRNKTQALSQLETYLQRADLPPRLRSLATELRTFLHAVSPFPSATSQNLPLRANPSGLNFTKSSSDQLIPNVGSALSNGTQTRESFAHIHVPAAFNWHVNV